MCKNNLNYVVSNYAVSQKKTGHCIFAHNSTNIDWFSKFFHRQTQQWLCNETVDKDRIAP